MRVLVVEDDGNIRCLLKQILEREGLQVLVADNGLEAVQLYRDNRPDVVFMNMMMPFMDGAESAHQILAIDPQARIVGNSGNPAFREKMMAAGCLDFLAAPYNPTEVIRSLQAAVSRTS